MVFEFSLDKSIALERVEFTNPLKGFASAYVWPSGICKPPDLDAPASLTIGDDKFNFVVDELSLNDDGGWIRVCPPEARAARYDVEVFSPAEGASFQQVIATRARVNAPPELAKKFPAIVADCTLDQLLNDVCYRNPGWAWWTGTDGLEIGVPAAAAIKCDGYVVSHTGKGKEIRLAEIAPRVGEMVELFCGTKGLALRTSISWHAGTMPIFGAVLGTLPAGVRRAPRRTVRWPAKVLQLAPFAVELTDEEQSNRSYRANARLMMRRSDRNRFQENLPIQAEDVLEAAVPTGGVSVLPLKVYAWREASPSEKYSVVAHTAEYTVAEQLTTSSKEKSETFCKGETRVSQRWDVNKT